MRQECVRDKCRLAANVETTFARAARCTSSSVAHENLGGTMGGCDRLIFRTAMLIVVLASTLFRVRVTYAEDYFESDPPLFWFGATGGLTVERRDPSLAYGLDVGAQLFVHNTIVALDVDALRQIQGARASVIFHTSFFGAELRTRYSYCCDRPYERRYVRGIKGFKFGVEIGKAPLDTFMTLEFGISRRSQHIWELSLIHISEPTR